MADGQISSMKAVFNRPEKPHPCKATWRASWGSEMHHVCDPHQPGAVGSFSSPDQKISPAATCHRRTFRPLLTHLEPLSKMSRERREVQIEAITGEERQTIMGQKPSQGVDEHMRRVLRAGAEIKHGQNLCAGVQWPARARAPVYSYVAWCAVHPAAGVGAGDGRRSVRARSAHAPQRVSAR